MIEPIIAGAALVEQVAATQPGEERLAVWWLGQSGYLLKCGSTLVAVDPFLSTLPAGTALAERLTAPPLDPAELSGLSLLVITQGAADHLDRQSLPELLKASPEALLVLPAGLADLAADELGVADQRLVPIAPGEFFERAGVTLHAFGAAGEGEPVAVEYVLAADGVAVYLAGAGLPYAGQFEGPSAFHPQVAFLPISGRGAKLQSLGLPGTLTAVEAARLAAELGARVLVPGHYDMFEAHAADPCALREFAKEPYPNLKVRILEPGARWIYPPEA